MKDFYLLSCWFVYIAICMHSCLRLYVYVNQLYKAISVFKADTHSSGSVAALDAANFLKKSGLSDVILSKVCLLLNML